MCAWADEVRVGTFTFAVCLIAMGGGGLTAMGGFFEITSTTSSSLSSDDSLFGSLFGSLRV
jgi:hypothetical protein